jgi:hypothetical protein
VYPLIIDNIPEGSGGRKVDKDGGIHNETIFYRILELDLRGQLQDSDEEGTSAQLANLKYSPEALQSWRDCIETALSREAFAIILEPFLHHETEGQLIKWPEDIPNRRESACFIRFELLFHLNPNFVYVLAKPCKRYS